MLEGTNLNGNKELLVRVGWIFAIALLLRLLLIPYFDYSLDDAYITFRVARNISNGQGMVYNPGERVLAVTTPLYTLLMVPGELTGIGAPMFSKVLNAVLEAGSCVLIFLLLAARTSKAVLWSAVLSLAFSPVAIFITLTGMESALFSFLVLLVGLLYREEKHFMLGICLGLLSLTRPEGFLLAVLCWLTVLINRRKELISLTVPFAVISIAWFAWATLYYGSVIPNSFTAKTAFFSQNPSGFMRNLASYQRYFSATVPLFCFAPVLVLWGSVNAFRRYREFAAPALWLFLIIFTQLTGDYYLAFWYTHMLLPIVLLLSFLGLQGLIDVLPAKVNSFFNTSKSVFVTGAVVLSILPFAGKWIPVENDMRNLDEHFGEIGHWFVENNIPEDRTVGIEAVGRIGYDSNLRVLDRMGLCSPEIIPSLLARCDSDANIMNTFRPDYYVTDIVFAEEEVAGYSIAASFPRSMVSRANNINAIMMDTTYIYQLRTEL